MTENWTNRILYRNDNEQNVREEIQQNWRETETNKRRRKVDKIDIFGNWNKI